LILVAALVLMAGGAQAATINVVGGQLMGASSVLVDGNLYDVQFLDGTCIALYNGCETSDFTFQTVEAATAAAQALVNEVFIDGPQGSFDTNPGLTNGIGAGEGSGNIWTPFVANQFNLAGIFAFNQDLVTNAGPPPPGDFVAQSNKNPDSDLSTSASSTYAVWSVASIPEPNTGLLVGLGLVALAGQRRLRDQR